MKLIFILLFLCVTSVKGMDNVDDTTDMLICYLKYEDRPTSILVPFSCWNRYFIKVFAKILTAEGISVAQSLQPGRTESQVHFLLIIADFKCPNVKEFLIEAYNEGYFKSPYRWLLLKDNDENRKVFQNVTMLVDSDVVLVSKQDDYFVFTDVYKISENSEPIYSPRLTWYPNRKNSTGTFDVALDNNTAVLNPLLLNINNTTVTFKDKGIIEDFRKTKVISVRRRDLRGHILTVVNVIAESNSTKHHLDDRLELHQDSITKMSYIAIKICFEMLNGTERRIFATTWGYKDKNGNWQGIIDALLKKEADLGTLTIFTQERMQVIDYIAMVGSTSVRFVFREPPLSYVSNIFALPFTGAVWLACFICVLGCSIFLYVASKWEASVDMHPLQLDGSWADVFVLAIGAVLQQGCTLEPRYAAGRCVTLLLYIALTILFSAYSANIVVLLRAPSSSVRSLTDLLNSPLKLGASDFEYNRYFFKKLNEPIRKAIYDKKIAPKGKNPNFYSMKEGIEKIRKGLFAFHMELNPGYRLIQETYQEGEKCDLVEIDYINEIDPWVPGQKRSPFKDMFKINFIKLRESGIQACNQRRIQVPKPKCSGSVTTFSSVGAADMYPVYLASAYGVLMAPAVLMIEIAYKKLMTAREKRKLRLIEELPDPIDFTN